MKPREMGMWRLLRISSALIVFGLGIEALSLLWFHPLSFVLFAVVGAAFLGLGILVFLASLVFAGTPSAAGPAGKPDL